MHPVYVSLGNIHVDFRFVLGVGYVLSVKLYKQKSAVRQTTSWIRSKHQSEIGVQELDIHKTLPPKTHAGIDGFHIPTAT
jgi:hypothetical protein